MTVHLDHRYHDDQGLGGATYQMLLPDGTGRSGALDSQGRATVDGVTAATVTVIYSPSTGAFGRKDNTPTPAHDPTPNAGNLGSLVEGYDVWTVDQEH